MNPKAMIVATRKRGVMPVFQGQIGEGKPLARTAWHTSVEMIGLYWHFVDIAWIVSGVDRVYGQHHGDLQIELGGYNLAFALTIAVIKGTLVEMNMVAMKPSVLSVRVFPCGKDGPMGGSAVELNRVGRNSGKEIVLMHGVWLEKIYEPERAASTLLEEMENTAAAIRQRAFDYYQNRGGRTGSDLDDWLRAEREVVWTPRAEMMENDEEVNLRVDAAGLEPRNLRVKVTPYAILIRADAGHRHDESGGKLCFCDFGEKLFRQFDLPKAIDVDRVSATLEKGILHIVAKWQPARQSRNVPVVAQVKQ